MLLKFGPKIRFLCWEEEKDEEESMQATQSAYLRQKF